MRKLFGIALGGCALAALVLFAGTPADAKCARVTATGVGIGEQMAKDMAKMNLEFGIADKKMKGKGKVTYKCTAPLASECKASQRAC
jgi:hypothetical protein